MVQQVSCPLIEVLWEKRTDEKAFRQRRAIQSESGFHVITRKPTVLERKEHPWAIIMTHAVHGDIIVPDIVRPPLRRIKYLDLVQKILEANPTKDLSRRDLVELWAAIFEKVYDFEHRWRECKRFVVGCIRAILSHGYSSLTLAADLGHQERHDFHSFGFSSKKGLAPSYSRTSMGIAQIERLFL